MGKNISIGNVESRSGSVQFGSIHISEIYDGSPIAVPVAIIDGEHEGPTIWIQNGVHGDECVGMRAIHQVLQTVSPKDVHGAIVLIPMLNVQAFRAGERMAPQDGMDMNRIWPGSPLEKAMHLFAHSELVVHQVFQYITEYADAVLDVHDCGRMGKIAPYAAFYTGAGDLGVRNKDLALATGFRIIWETQPAWVQEKVPGSIKTQMLKLGRPSATLEIGGEGRLHPEAVAGMYRSLMNCIKHMGIVKGKVEKASDIIYIKQGNWLRPTRGGVLNMLVDAAQEVAKGEVLAIITDLFGREVERLISPVDGVVIGCRTLAYVATGQYTVNVGTIER
jgi:predicted deacylase